MTLVFSQPLDTQEFWNMRYLLSASRTQPVFGWETENARLLEVHVLLFRDQSIPDLSDHNIWRKAL